MTGELATYRQVYFLGIGGIGMSALARWFKAQGFLVGGYDKTESQLTQELVREGMDIHYDLQSGRIPTAFYKKSETLVVVTPAVPQTHVEYQYFQHEKYVMMKRSQVLGLITKSYYTIAIAGTHGKTTTSSLTAHLLKSAGIQVNAFLGGITANYGTNLLIGTPDAPVVVEADEYDRSFLTLFPDQAVVTSMDADHLDIYGSHEEVKKSFQEFVLQLKPGGFLLKKEGLPLQTSGACTSSEYHLERQAVHAENIRIEDGCFQFDYVDGEHRINGLVLQVPGYHNVENALAAITMVRRLQIPEEKIRAGIQSFLGVKRRFQYILKTEKITLIDDYAHHPAEVEALLTSVRGLYPSKKVTCIFQPHLYSRTRDFAAEFAQSLSLADEILLLDIYPAREAPIPGVSSASIAEGITGAKVQRCSKEEMIERLQSMELEVVLTVGAGDIDTYLDTLKEALEKKNE
ncbi:MAG: UDP-N-acetylmuramate--L-alanine ligase [Cytophagaceae bacterium]|jgi:UDP-N-acetylmuramate--alanine ligase|nr:UDP-N-acetylmuramate--L-alanine ligase [Cytophagaceae bacterium]